MKQERLRIAIQKKGRLNSLCVQLLKDSGMKFSTSGSRLLIPVENMNVDLLLVRSSDIADLVADGVVDLGILGENSLQESQYARYANGEESGLVSEQKLGFGKCRLSIAVETSEKYAGPEGLNGKTIATSYPNIVNNFLDEKSISASVTKLSGSVEVAPRTGLADAVADLVSTGSTLEANGLKEVEKVADFQAVLVRNKSMASPEKTELFDRLLKRVKSVLQARESKYIMLHCDRDKLEDIKKLLPGFEDPTVISLASEENRVALHMVSSETLFWETIEDLKALGASSILVLPIEKMMA